MSRLCGRQIVREGPVTTFLEQRTDSDNRVRCHRVRRRGHLQMAVGQVVVVLPASQQTSCTVDARRGVPVDDELLNKSLGIRLTDGSSSLRPGASSSTWATRVPGYMQCVMPTPRPRSRSKRVPGPLPGSKRTSFPSRVQPRRRGGPESLEPGSSRLEDRTSLHT